MKKLIFPTLVPILAFSPVLVFAGLADGANLGALGTLMLSILKFINHVVIPFILGIGFLVFVWGMFRYFIAGGANDDAKEKGKNVMIYATLGFVLIIIFWGVVNLIAGSTGLDDAYDTSLTPETGYF